MKGQAKKISVICAVIITIVFTLHDVPWKPVEVVKTACAMEYQSELQLGTLSEVTLAPRVCREWICQFVPAETDTYIFYSLSDSATAAYLYGSNGTRLQSDDMRSGRNENFSLECVLVAGSTYYFGAQYAESSSMSGSFLVGIKKLAKADEVSTSSELSVGSEGLEYSISPDKSFVYAQFSPSADGYYNIYSKNFCGQAGKCTTSCGCGGQCDCLDEIMITVYTKDKDGKLESLYYADAGTEGGVLLHNYFEKDQVYYIEMSASDGQKTGRFKLYVDTKLADAPVDLLKFGSSIEKIINGIQDTILYKIVPEKTGTYRLLSGDGDGLYMTLYHENMEEMVTTDAYDNNFDQVVNLQADEVYYLVLKTNSNRTFYFDLKTEVISTVDVPETSSEPGETVPPGGGTNPPGETDPPGGGSNPPGETDPSGGGSNPPGGTGPSGGGSNPSGGGNAPSGTGGNSSGADGGATGTGTGSLNAVSMDEVSILPVPDQAYTGKDLSPSVQASYEETDLEEDEDYTVSYKNNKKIGVGTITLAGKGKFSGSQSVTFKIVPARVVIKKGSRTGQSLSLQWKKVKGATDYEITYAYAANFKGKKKVTVKKCKAVLKLTSTKKCYVKVRAYKTVKKKKYYGAMSKKKQF